MKTAVGVLIMIHGLITMGLSAGSFDSSSTGVANPAWLKWWPTPMGKSWVLALIGQSRSASIEPILGVLWLIAGIAIVAGGLGLLGFIVPAAYWRLLAGFGAVLSLVVIALYAHPYYVIGIAANIAILAALFWAALPVRQALGS